MGGTLATRRGFARTRPRRCSLCGLLLAPGIVVSPVLFAALPARADNLSSALADAYQLNQQIAAERATVQGKDENAAEAKANLWRPHITFQPQVSIARTPEHIKDTFLPPHKPRQGDMENNDNTQTERLLQINATMNLFDSGLTAAQLREAKGLINAERGILKTTEQGVFQNVATQYGQIVLNQLLAQAALETRQDTERLRGIVKALEAEHFVTSTAVSQIEEQYQGSVASYEQARAAVAAARAQFLALVGRPAGKIEGWPALKPKPPALEPAIKIALADNPQVFTARSELAAAQAAVDVAKAELLPVLSVFGNVSRDWTNTHFTGNNVNVPSGLPPYYSNTNSANATVGLRLTMPLYQGGSEYANVRQQIDTVLQNQRLLINAQATVRGAVEAAWKDLEGAREQYRATTAQVEAARLALAGMKRQFADGTETITDVLTEERNLSSALAAAAQAGYSYFTAVVAFQVATGSFNAKDLHLPVQLYDPLDHYRAVKDKWIGFDVGGADDPPQSHPAK